MKTKTFKNIRVTGSLSNEAKHEIASIFASWYLENKYKKQNNEKITTERSVQYEQCQALRAAD